MSAAAITALNNICQLHNEGKLTDAEVKKLVAVVLSTQR